MNELAMQPVGAMEPSTQMMVLSRGKMTNLMITHITDLPAVVLGSILAHLNDPVDVAAALCTCKLFWTLARTAPFHLRLRPRQPEEPPGGNSEDSLQNKYAISTEFSFFLSFFLAEFNCSIRHVLHLSPVASHFDTSDWGWRQVMRIDGALYFSWIMVWCSGVSCDWLVSYVVDSFKIDILGAFSVRELYHYVSS